ILLAVQLDLTCLRNTARLLHLLRQYEGLVDRVRVVANRVGSRDCEISLKKAQETLNLQINWQGPNAVKEFNESRSPGVTLGALAPGSKSHRPLLELARNLVPPSTGGNTRRKTGLGRFAAMFA